MLLWGCLVGEELVADGRVTGTRGVGWQDSVAWALAWERSVC
jgi:hypothetical protein